MVAARGELDGSTTWRLQDALSTATATGAHHLIADLGAVTYLDADALAMLVASAARVHRAGSRLAIVTDHPWLVRLLRAAKFDGVVRVEPTLRDVVNSLPVSTSTL
jgi:anti-anti-sigma factor